MPYKKPVLKEILAEFALEKSALPQSGFLDLGKALAGAGFPETEFGQVETYSLTPQFQAIAASVNPRIRCWSTDRTELAQFSEDFLAVNLAHKYPGKGHFIDLVKKAVACLPRPAIAQLSVITIDEIKTPAGGYALGKLLNCGGPIIPSWYSDTSEAADITLGKGVVGTDGYNRSIRVTVRVQDSMVTIQITSIFRQAVGKGDAFTTLHQLLDESTHSFESIVTDYTRRDVMGGRV